MFGDDATVAEFSKINLAHLQTIHPDVVTETDWSAYDPMDLENIEKLPEVPKVTFVSEVPKDGLARRVTANVVPVVRWRIQNAIDFMVNIGSEEEVDRQIEDEMVSVLQRLLPKMSAGQALENMAWINAHLFDSVVRRTLKWGILIEGAYLKKLPFHHSLNKAIAGATEAEFTGRADKELAIMKGQGAAAAARALEEETLKGRGAGLKQIAEDLGLDGAAVQGAEVARAFADGGNTFIAGLDGFGQLGGIVAAVTKKNNSPDSSATPPAGQT